MMSEIEIVPVYRIKGDKKKFRTYDAVLRRLAWKIVFDKYGDGFDDDFPWCSPRNEPRNEPRNYKCDCDVKKYDEDEGDWVESFWLCPVHDRKDGYLKRLHTRLVRYIMLRYPMPRLAGDDPLDK